MHRQNGEGPRDSGIWQGLMLYGPNIIKVWQDAKNDTATNKNNFKRGMDWHEMLQEMYGENCSQLEDKVDQKVRESVGRVNSRMFVPETNGLVIATCLCEVLDMKLNEQTYQRFFCNRALLDEAMKTFVDFRRLVKDEILIDRFAA